MNISTTFINALKRTSSDIVGQRSPEFLLGQLYNISLEENGFLLPLAGGEFRLLNPFIMNGTLFLLICCSIPLRAAPSLPPGAGKWSWIMITYCFWIAVRDFLSDCCRGDGVSSFFS